MVRSLFAKGALASAEEALWEGKFEESDKALCNVDPTKRLLEPLQKGHPQRRASRMAIFCAPGRIRSIKRFPGACSCFHEGHHGLFFLGQPMFVDGF